MNAKRQKTILPILAIIYLLGFLSSTVFFILFKNLFLFKEMHRVTIRQPLDWHSPEEDLQEISMLEDQEAQLNYKTPLSSRDVNFQLDGWVHSHPHLLSFKSDVLENAAHLKYKKQTQETCRTPNSPSSPSSPGPRHKHSASFSEAVDSHSHNFTAARYHIRRVQSHQWQSEEKPIHRLSNTSNRSLSHHAPQPLQKGAFNQAKFKVFESAQLMRRTSVDAVSYPMVLNSPERKVAGAVGRVRRLLKIKIQKRN